MPVPRKKTPPSTHRARSPACRQIAVPCSEAPLHQTGHPLAREGLCQWEPVAPSPPPHQGPRVRQSCVDTSGKASHWPAAQPRADGRGCWSASCMLDPVSYLMTRITGDCSLWTTGAPTLCLLWAPSRLPGTPWGWGQPVAMSPPKLGCPKCCQGVSVSACRSEGHPLHHAQCLSP